MALPATLGKSIPTNPCPLGKVAPTVPGTAVQLVSNFTDLGQRQVHFCHVRGLDSNTGQVYVLFEVGLPPWTLPGGGAATGADKTNYLNVVQILQASESWDIPSWMMNQLHLGQIWIDADNANEGVLAAFGEA